MQATMLFLVGLSASLLAAPPMQQSVAPVLGPKAYHDGDVVEITDVTATSAKLEHGDTVRVKGRVRLDSHESANLCLYLTQIVGDGLEEVDRTQTVEVTKGLHEFDLSITIKHKGVLHLTFYDTKTGSPFGGTYFGTREQMQQIADWDVGYYLTR